jgi:hypothetical protein
VKKISYEGLKNIFCNLKFYIDLKNQLTKFLNLHYPLPRLVIKPAPERDVIYYTE